MRTSYLNLLLGRLISEVGQAKDRVVVLGLDETECELRLLMGGREDREGVPSILSHHELTSWETLVHRQLRDHLQGHLLRSSGSRILLSFPLPRIDLV